MVGDNQTIVNRLKVKYAQRLNLILTGKSITEVDSEINRLKRWMLELHIAKMNAAHYSLGAACSELESTMAKLKVSLKHTAKAIGHHKAAYKNKN